MVQFFHYPVFGGLLLTLLIVGAQALTAHFFKLTQVMWLASFAPPLIVVSAVIWISYYVYNVLPINLVYSVFPGMVVAFVPIAFYCRGSTFLRRCMILALVLLILFPLAGVYALLGGIFCFAGEAGQSAKLNRYVRLVVLMLLILSLPLLWLWHFRNSVTLDQLYFHGLFPDEIRDLQYVRTLFCYPLLIMSAMFFWLGLVAYRVLYPVSELNATSQVEPVNADQDHAHETSPDTEPAPTKNGNMFGWGVFALLLLMTIFGTCRSPSFFLTLAMQRPLDNDDWRRIIELDRYSTEPVRPTIMARNLALFEQNQLADMLFEWPQSGRVSQILVTVSTYRIYGDKVLYRCGLVNYAAKAATNKLVSIPDSAGMTRIFVQIALVQKRYEVARKFIERLEKTLVHRNWVRKYRAWLNEHDRASGHLRAVATGSTDPALVASVQRELDLIGSRLPGANYFTDVALPEFYIMELGQHDGFEKTTREMQTLNLVGSMLTRSRSGFMNHIESYVKEMGNDPLPRHIQEAWIYYSSMESGKISQVYPWDKLVLERFKTYIDLTLRQKSERPDRRTLEQKAVFANTFWWYANDVPDNLFY